ncbi:unnamed protein product [Urochloa decumbens]|uniref:MCAfunc domain-containing protein n=1 Tax=Urochloa decumbens TaxID=240449 RepID=A0ABC9EHA8_9POAL
MAAWSSLAQAASAAHLPGAAEALRLVAMVVQAAQTVSRNRRTCRRLGERAAMVGELLQQLQGSEVMRRRETMRPLVALEETLRRAHRLIVACQGSAAAYRFLMGRKHADQLREVEKDMDSFLLLIPLVKHVHDTRPSNLVESDAAYPLCSQPGALVVLGRHITLVLSE